MKTQIIFVLAAAVGLAAGCASKPPKPATTAVLGPLTNAPSPGSPRGGPPAPLIVNGQQVYTYNQQVMAQPMVLYSPQQTDEIVNRFKANLEKLGNPKMLIYVNRALVDEQSGMRMTAHYEQIDSTRTATTTNAPGDTNAPGHTQTDVTRNSTRHSYDNNPKPVPTLADRQTMRDVERLMGRPLRAAGVSVVDQGVATQLIGDRPLESITTENEQARKDREAIGKIADVVLEVLLSSRTVTVAELNGDNTYSVPEIHATAIRLKDSKIIGQASASDVINKAGGPGAAARNYAPQDVTEATSLSLMEDMVKEAK